MWLLADRLPGALLAQKVTVHLARGGCSGKEKYWERATVLVFVPQQLKSPGTHYCILDGEGKGFALSDPQRNESPVFRVGVQKYLSGSFETFKPIC